MRVIGLCGTFDVENFGDLLFPLIAEHELRQRLDPLVLQCFSYAAKRAPEWPFDVTSQTKLAASIDTLDALILGGGDLIHCIKSIARHYFPPDETLHHPTSLWLTPALLALEQGLPLIWNAPGVPQEIPDWAVPAVRAVLVSSAYIAVRDEPSRQALAVIAPEVDIAVVPDTAFGIARLRDAEHRSLAFRNFAAQLGLQRPYVVLQPGAHGSVERLLRAASLLSASHQIVILPLGPVHGEHQASVPHSLFPEAIRLPRWPDPLLLTELIAGSEGAIGDSLHLAIVALACGVPVFRSPRRDLRKYAMLERFDTVHSLKDESAASSEWLSARLGRKAPSQAALGAADAVKAHWDKVASVLSSPPSNRAVPLAIKNLWQRLPGDLESRAELATSLATARHAIDAARAENAALRNSLSWKVTAPLRGLLEFARSTFARSMRRSAVTPTSDAALEQAKAQVIRFEAIEHRHLSREPYDWTLVDGLFSAAHADNLAATFPRDRFKIVKGYDSEKDYAYHARALIGMGSTTIAHAEGLSPAWRQLAADLLSRRYRMAMTRLTGIDLSQVRMEVNVFHYGPGAWLGPHVDLPDKIVTHVLYFNPSWNVADGGCLSILRSSDMSDSACAVPPIVGTSAVLVRSDKSWHAVSRVDPGCVESRRSVTVTFYRDDAVSTLWPMGDDAPTFDYGDAERQA
jgi:lipopolysaccharide transport system ATP-binding protein